MDGRNGRTNGQRQNYITPTLSGDKNSHVTHIKYVFCHFVVYLFLKIFVVPINAESVGRDHFRF